MFNYEHEQNLGFKPSGFNMEWYKYPWRSPMMSENLTLGEIRRIWRLCIDHLLTGRTFEPGPTSRLLEERPARVEVPEALAERAGRVCAMASAQEAVRSRVVCHTSRSTYRGSPDGYDADAAAATIEVLKGRMGRG